MHRLALALLGPDRALATRLFWCAFWITASVSAYDLALSIRLREALPDFEENPLGRWLIGLNGGDITLFMAAKIVGTTLVMAAFVVLLRFRRTWGVLVASGVAVFQIWLLCYLTFADPWRFTPQEASPLLDAIAEAEAEASLMLPDDDVLELDPWPTGPAGGEAPGAETENTQAVALTDVQADVARWPRRFVLWDLSAADPY